MNRAEAASPVVCVLDAKATLGECPVWCARAQALYWVDIYGRTLNRFEPTSGTTRAWAMPEEIGCFALREAGGAVVALRSGFHGLDFATGAVTRLAPPPNDPATSRFNDGRVDRSGKFFWAGTMIEKRDGATGVLYRRDEHGEIRAMATGATVSNGLAFSPDSKIMYWSDSEGRTIWTFDHEPETGEISNRRVLKQFAPGEGHPDGATVDAEGYYWSALYRGGRIIRLAPDGSLDREIAMPVPCPTMPVFGGPDLTTLYVTTARSALDEAGLAKYPLSGGIFAVETGIKGLADVRYRG